ncbi:MAG: hypothetical protein KGO96_02670 [Elusimicrobia bacterium]|nr:hypothetical protein [Elusimicrobiota bacterium]MDE2236570.1 hypothetical protein [Elusimicrobiota bacterium]MDE2424796.1 hypothetical protein [Elusimicrobiota bacterium]
MPVILRRKHQGKKRESARLSVDFPRQGEIISFPTYTLRLSAPQDLKNVEVSIDGGAWRACRQAEGFWWYDWSDYDDGEHSIVTRVELREGRMLASEPHQCFVDLQPKRVP